MTGHTRCGTRCPNDRADGRHVAEVPDRTREVHIDWNNPDDEPDWWADDYPGKPWISTGSWSVTLEGHGEILRTTEYSNDDGFPTAAEAVAAVEKWAIDRGLEITTFGIRMRTHDAKPLRGAG